MLTRVSLPILASVFMLSSVACNNSDSKPPPATPITTTTTVETTSATSSGGTTGDTFGALRAIHMAEVEHGNLAQKKAIDPRVKAFAEKVVADHKQRMAKDDQLMSGLGITARETSLTAQIKAAGDQQSAKLDSLSGPAFDAAYLDEQVTYYRWVLDTFDRSLIPNARDPQIKRVLEEARGRANDHLREAQDIRLSLASGTVQ